MHEKKLPKTFLDIRMRKNVGLCEGHRNGEDGSTAPRVFLEGCKELFPGKLCDKVRKQLSLCSWPGKHGTKHTVCLEMGVMTRPKAGKGWQTSRQFRAHPDHLRRTTTKFASQSRAKMSAQICAASTFDANPAIARSLHRCKAGSIPAGSVH